MPSIMFCFGLVMTMQGLVTNFAGLCATRFFLGLCEAGAFPVSSTPLSWLQEIYGIVGMLLLVIDVV